MRTGDKKVKVSIGHTVYDSSIRQKTITVDRLFKILSEPKARKKKDGDYFIFASFKENTRTASNVLRYYGCTIDIDDTDLSIREVRKVFKEFRACVYTTHSHLEKGKGKRYRVVIPYSHEVNKETHVNLCIYLMNLIGIDAFGKDLVSTKALSRPMYLPAAPHERIDKFYFHDNKVDKLFDTQTKYELPGDVQWQLMQEKLESYQKIDITESVDEGGRNDRIAKIAGTLIQQGHTYETILSMCIDINAARFSPPMREVEVTRTVKSVWESHTRNNNDSDWSYEQILERLEVDPSVRGNLDHYIHIISKSVKSKKTNSIQKKMLFKSIKKKIPELTVSDINEQYQIVTQGEKQTATKQKYTDTATFADEQIDIVEILKNDYKDFFYVSPDNMLFNRKNNKFYKLEGFNNANMHVQADTGLFNQTPFRILQQVGAIETVDGVQYNPAREKVYTNFDGSVCLNTYDPPDIVSIGGKTRLLERHFRYLFKNRFERNVLLDFIAYQVQHPGTKFMWTPIIKGHKGIGKGIIANEIIAPILGPRNVGHINNSAQMQGRFNSWQAGTQLVVVHELFISHRMDVKHQVTEALKSFITDRYLSVERKGVDAFQIENITNMMAFTNNEDAIYITEDERRFCMIRTEAIPKSPDYYSRLVGWLRANIGVVHHYFANRKIKSIVPTALPKTDYTTELAESSKDWAHIILDNMYKDKQCVFYKYNFLSWKSICNVIIDYAHKSNIYTVKMEDVFNASSGMGRVLRQALVDGGMKAYKSGTTERFKIHDRHDKIYITKNGIRTRCTNLRPAVVRKMCEEFEENYVKTVSDFSNV